MQLDEGADERQADAEAAVAALERGFDLGEHVEDMPKHLTGDANTRVADLYDDVAALPFAAEPDSAAAFGVLGGVGEEVCEDLREPCGVGFHFHRLPRQADG